MIFAMREATPRLRRIRTVSGFTLVELLLTVTLLSLVVAYVVINVEGMIPVYRIEGAARELGATVAEVQAMSAVKGKTHGVVYDLEKGRYWILAPPPAEEDEEDRDKKKARDGEPPPLEALTPRRLHEGVSIKDVSLGGERKKRNGTVKILFAPDGTGMPHAIHIEGKGERKFTIEVNPYAGTVEFFEGYKEFDIFVDEEN